MADYKPGAESIQDEPGTSYRIKKKATAQRNITTLMAVCQRNRGAY